MILLYVKGAIFDTTGTFGLLFGLLFRYEIRIGRTNICRIQQMSAIHNLLCFTLKWIISYSWACFVWIQSNCQMRGQRHVLRLSLDRHKPNNGFETKVKRQSSHTICAAGRSKCHLANVPSGSSQMFNRTLINGLCNISWHLQSYKQRRSFMSNIKLHKTMFVRSVH